MRAVFVFLHIICLVFSMNSLSQAVTINNVSGVLSNGMTITINGSNFGTKSSAMPLISSYDHGVNANNFSTAKIGGDWDTRGGTMLGSEGQYQRTSFYQAEYYSNSPYMGDDYSQLKYDAPLSAGLYFYTSMWLYVTKSPFCNSTSGYNSKFWRWYVNSSNHGATISENFRSSTSSQGACVSGYAAGNNVTGIDHGLGEAADYLPLVTSLQEWVHHEVWVFAGSDGNTDGRWIEKVNGKTVRNWGGWGLLTSYNSHDINYFRFGQVSGENYSGGSILLTEVYVDNTQAHVFLSDKSTMPANWLATDMESHDEVQVCSNWSNSSITCTLNQGTFIAGDDAYVYVVDADGDVNTQGFHITIGG
jgi:hypothetical protein